MHVIPTPIGFYPIAERSGRILPIPLDLSGGQASFRCVCSRSIRDPTAADDDAGLGQVCKLGVNGVNSIVGAASVEQTLEAGDNVIILYNMGHRWECTARRLSICRLDWINTSADYHITIIFVAALGVYLAGCEFHLRIYIVARVQHLLRDLRREVINTTIFRLWIKRALRPQLMAIAMAVGDAYAQVYLTDQSDQQSYIRI
jgi:hypothetical protein